MMETLSFPFSLMPTGNAESEGSFYAWPAVPDLKTKNEQCGCR